MIVVFPDEMVTPIWIHGYGYEMTHIAFRSMEEEVTLFSGEFQALQLIVLAVFGAMD